MLLNDLYTVEQSDRDPDGTAFTVIIRINPLHDVFKGHFPGNPILPGVCIIQIMKEILIAQHGGRLCFTNLDSIKFLSVIDPGQNSLLRFDAKMKGTANGSISFNASLCSESVVFCRIKGDFRFGTPVQEAV